VVCKTFLLLIYYSIAVTFFISNAEREHINALLIVRIAGASTENKVVNLGTSASDFKKLKTLFEYFKKVEIIPSRKSYLDTYL
jgi:hypothetical protein